MMLKTCEECTELKMLKGVPCCYECFNKPIAEIDECPLGITEEEVKEMESVKTPKLVARAEVQKERKPRVRKADDFKRYMIELIKETLEGADMENINVLNVEREIEFMNNGKKYKLTLSAPRK